MALQEQIATLYKQGQSSPQISRQLGISRGLVCYYVRTAGIKPRGPHKDLTGRIFGRLTVIKRLERDAWGNFRWECQCSCGQSIEVAGSNLQRGTQSCGCLRREVAAGNGELKKTHGMTETKAYSSWSGMLGRCRNPNLKEYKSYGGRGVTVCDRWDPRKGGSFENFYADMGEPPTPNHSIDKDKLGDGLFYSPETCCWLDPKEQNRNKRNSRFISFEGERKTVAEWAEDLGMNYSTLARRIKDPNWSTKQALTTPVRGQNV